MSENTRDEFEQTSADTPGEEVPSHDEVTSQTEPPADGETPASTENSLTEQPAEAKAPAEEQPVETAPAPTPESSLPPEAQGEANGGPLGCCLGTMVGLLLSLSLAILSRAYATSLGDLLQGNFWLLGLLVRILMGIMAFVLAIVFGYFGWRLGKRFYKEYEPPPVRTRQRRSGSKKARQKA